MIKFLLWCILLVLCWPLALLALVLYPLVWIFLLPFRLLGIAVGGVLELFAAVITLRRGCSGWAAEPDNQRDDLEAKRRRIS
jgi:hypothetical protein